MIRGKQVALLAGALVRAGAKWTPVFRQKTDPNGMPAGKPVRVGCILGKLYTKGNFSTLRIDIPGIVLHNDVTRFEGILAHDCGAIHKQDEICVAGARYRILRVGTARSNTRWETAWASSPRRRGRYTGRSARRCPRTLPA